MADWAKRLKKFVKQVFNRINQENLAHLKAYQDMVEKEYGTRPSLEEVFEAIMDKYATREHKIELEVPEFGTLALNRVNEDHVKLLEAACEENEKVTGKKPALTVAADEYMTRFFARDGEYNEYLATLTTKPEKKADKPKVKATTTKVEPPKAETLKVTPPTLEPAEPEPETPSTSFGGSTGSSFGGTASGGFGGGATRKLT